MTKNKCDWSDSTNEYTEENDLKLYEGMMKKLTDIRNLNQI